MKNIKWFGLGLVAMVFLLPKLAEARTYTRTMVAPNVMEIHLAATDIEDLFGGPALCASNSFGIGAVNVGNTMTRGGKVYNGFSFPIDITEDITLPSPQDWMGVYMFYGRIASDFSNLYNVTSCMSVHLEGTGNSTDILFSTTAPPPPPAPPVLPFNSFSTVFIGNQTEMPSSTLQIGIPRDGIYNYFQLDTESSAPPPQDCLANTLGRSLFVASQTAAEQKLYICGLDASGNSVWTSAIFN